MTKVPGGALWLSIDSLLKASTGGRRTMRPCALVRRVFVPRTADTKGGNVTVVENFKGDEPDFVSKLEEAQNASERYFREVANASKITDTDWTSDEYLEQFLEEIHEAARKKKGEAMDKMVEDLGVTYQQKSIKSHLEEPFEEIFGEAPPQMWRKIVSKLKETVEEAETKMRKRFTDFAATPTQINTYSQSLLRTTYTQFQELLKDQIGDNAMHLRLKNVFDDRFKCDEQGVPRVWKPTDDIDGVYRRAVEEAEKYLSLFAKIDVPLSEFSFLGDETVSPSNLIAIPTTRQQSLREKLKRDANQAFLDAKRSIVVTMGGVPRWAYILMLILGWNEIIMVLTNPMAFLLLALCAAGTYGLWYTGMLWPVLKFSRNTLEAAARQ
ncbi:Dynamin-like GTPase that mediates homotypic ER fusion, partial [Quaeritorhiza haematococci]